VDANRDDAERLALMLPGEDVRLVPTHWSFGRLASFVGAPATYLRQLPAPLMRRTATSSCFWSTTSIRSKRLPDGSPDLYFRGFYCWNSEVGAKTLGIASFYLRAVCQNRNLWGVEDFEEITIRHSKFAASRFAFEAAPALTRFANSSPMPFVNGIKSARERIVARTDEERTDFLRKRGFSKSETAKIIETVLAEEGRRPESIFDFVQGITAVARDKPHQDARLDLETRAKKLLDRVA
jgi:hypothetical protein